MTPNNFDIQDSFALNLKHWVSPTHFQTHLSTWQFVQCCRTSSLCQNDLTITWRPTSFLLRPSSYLYERILTNEISTILTNEISTKAVSDSIVQHYGWNGEWLKSNGRIKKLVRWLIIKSRPVYEPPQASIWINSQSAGYFSPTTW